VRERGGDFETDYRCNEIISPSDTLAGSDWPAKHPRLCLHYRKNGCQMSHNDFHCDEQTLGSSIQSTGTPAPSASLTTRHMPRLLGRRRIGLTRSRRAKG
jgi:hypothetical protein